MSVRLGAGGFCDEQGVALEGQYSGHGRQIKYDDLLTNIESTLTNQLSEVPQDQLENLYLDMRQVMNPWPHVVFEGASLSRVFRLYRGIGIRHLPVININNEVVGMLCRKELRTDWKGDSLI